MGFVPDLRAVSGDALRAVSDGAIEQLAGRFDGLPRPLLAAIGAGDLAVEHLAVLRESVRKQVDGLDLDAREVVAAAAGVAASVQNFAGELPRRLQEMAAELPGRVAALTRATGDVDPGAVVSTLEAYTEAAGVIYGGLARRGDRIWSDARGASSRPGSVVDATPDRAAGTVRARGSAPTATPSSTPTPTSRRAAAAPATRTATRRATAAAPAPATPTGGRKAAATPAGGRKAAASKPRRTATSAVPPTTTGKAKTSTTAAGRRATAATKTSRAATRTPAGTSRAGRPRPSGD